LEFATQELIQLFAVCDRLSKRPSSKTVERSDVATVGSWARGFCLLHPLFRIDAEDQPRRYVVAIRQLNNYVRDFRGSLSARPRGSQHLELEPTDVSYSGNSFARF